MFDSKDFEMLHNMKIRDYENIPISARYFISINDCMLFIKKSRKFYKLMASCQCGFEPAWREATLDVLAINEDLDFIKNLFYGYCLRLIEVNNVLH